MDLPDVCLLTVRETYPSLAVTAWSSVQRCQNCLVCVADDRIVFRFPRYRNAFADFVREAAILDALRDRLPLPVPNPIYRKLDWTNDTPFIGYEKIPGRPCDPGIIHRLDAGTIVNIAAQLADFLEALHRTALPAAIFTDLPQNDTRTKYEAMYAEIRTRLFDHMSLRAKEATTHFFETYISQDDHFDYEPCLRHGDFGPTNILIDESSGQITGVIDFGSAGLGDPAYDYSGILCYGEAFLERVGSARPDFARMHHRAKFYKQTFALQEALFGLAQDDPNAFNRGMAPYR